MENIFLPDENLLFFVVFCLVLILFQVLTMNKYKKDIEILENENKNQQNTISLLMILINQNSSEEELINFIKENEISSLDLDDEYFINYYENVIKKGSPEAIGRHLIYIEKKLLGFFKYQAISEKLYYYLKKAIMRNISLSAMIVADSIKENNVYTEKCKNFILIAFSEKNKEIFPYNNEREKNVSSFLRLFFSELEKFHSLIYEKEIDLSKKREIEKQFVNIKFSLIV